MNFVEVIDLMRTITAFQAKSLNYRPKLSVWDTQTRDNGYVLCMRKDLVNNEYLAFLTHIAETRRLAISHIENILIVFSSRNFNEA
jgi:hypothetical protein